MNWVNDLRVVGFDNKKVFDDKKPAKKLRAFFMVKAQIIRNIIL